jgi:uncharacterized secreted protein with C-terminal beta-propeller domain
MIRRSSSAVAAAGVALVAATGVFVLAVDTPPARADGLVPWAGCDDLVAHHRSALSDSGRHGYGLANGSSLQFSLDAGAVAADSSAARATGGEAESGAVGSNESGTNVQERGVDEPDVAKLSDGRIVTVTDRALHVLSGGPSPQVLGSLDLGPGRTWGAELLVVGDRVLVIAPGSRPYETGDAPSGLTYSDGGDPTTTMLLVDVATGRPRLLERSVQDGQYLSARLVDGTVRVVTHHGVTTPWVYSTTAGKAAREAADDENERVVRELTADAVVPQVTRTSADGTVLSQGPAVACEDVSHPDDPRGAQTLVVTTLRPDAGLAPTDSVGVTTEADTVYAAADRMYVASSRWGVAAMDVAMFSPLDPMTGAEIVPVRPDPVTTQLHAFDTSSTDATEYVATGSVDGRLLNRWSLSRHDDALRVATTIDAEFGRRGRERAPSSSSVVKLVERGGELVETGRVDGLGLTEEIKAVRFLGDVAAVVTFRQTDPLYLLDLSGDPKVLGELKIPGFSTYLHPVGDGLLLGLGQDADERGRVTGLQASVFDVSDLSAPTLVSKVLLADNDTWSPATDESRAFTYDPQRRTAVIPLQTYDRRGRERSTVVGLTVGADGRLAESARPDLSEARRAMRSIGQDAHLHVVGPRGIESFDAAWVRTGAVLLPR